MNRRSTDVASSSIVSARQRARDAASGTWALAGLLLIGLTIRLLLAFVVFPQSGLWGDIDAFNDWALELVEYGLGGFYANVPFADFTPALLYVLWLFGLGAKTVAELTGGVAPEIISIWIKLPAILADAAVAIVLYRTVARWQNPAAALVVAGAYLLNPVTWYDSALWGQVESIGALALVLSVVWLIDRRPELAVSAAVVACMVKPQFAIVLFVVGIVVLRRHAWRRAGAEEPLQRHGPEGWLQRTFGEGPGRILSSGLTAVLTLVVLAVPFDLETRAPSGLENLPILGDVAGLLVGLGARLASYNVLTANAYNPWALVGPSPLSNGVGFWTNDSLPILGIPASFVGQALFIAVAALVTFLLWRRDDRYSILLAVTVLAVAIFVLPTRVHERYLFGAIAVGAFLVPMSRGWLAWFVTTSAVLLINMHAILSLPYAGYGTPELRGLPLAALAREPFVVIAVSLLSIAVLAWPIWQLVRVPPVSFSTERAATVPPPTEPTVVARATASASTRQLAARPADKPRLTSMFDRLDWLVVLVLLVAGLLMRVPGLERPFGMYFDENLHVKTAAEFLQGWRYGMPKETTEWTHPHLAKYAIAASVELLGGHELLGAVSLQTEVSDAVVEPGRTASDGRLLHNSRLYVAGPGGVLVTDLIQPASRQRIEAPAAVRLALDDELGRLWIGSADGVVRYVETQTLDPTSGAPDAVATEAFRLTDPVSGLWSLGPGAVLLSDGRTLTLFADGALRATIELPEVADAALLPGDQQRVAVVNVSGLHILDAASLSELQTLTFDRRPYAVAVIEGNDFDQRARGLLAAPVAYVVTFGGTIVRIDGVDGDNMLVGGQFQMPGEAVDVRWNPSTNLVHVLGVENGRPTIFVVDPRGESVFADATLPIAPIAFDLDVRRENPAVDRQVAVAVDPSGNVATVGVGGTMSAARLPGVMLGAGTVALVYALARALFRRRDLAILAGGLLLAEGLVFAQSRIATPDTYTGFFVVAAYLGLALLLRPGIAPRPIRGRWLITAFIGIGALLGLAAATKWTGVYAIGGVALMLLLATSGMTRWLGLALAGIAAVVLSLHPLTNQPPDLVFPALAVAGIALLAVLVRSWQRDPDGWSSPITAGQLAWGIPLLVVTMVAVYVISYVPYLFLDSTSPQLIAGWPPGHSGEALVDLHARMFAFHEESGQTHGAGSPWWSWPLMLKPLWAYLETFVGSQSTIFMAPNPAILWLSIPALAYVALRLLGRVQPALLLIVLAFAVQWLPWARIDRVAFMYHYYTAVPFAVVALAYLLWRLWSGPSARTWLWARAVAVAAIALVPLQWLASGPLCAGLNTDSASALCTGVWGMELPVGAVAWAVLWVAVVLAATVWLSKGASETRPAHGGDWLVPAALGAVLLVGTLATGMPAMLSATISLGSPMAVSVLATLLAVPLVVLVVLNRSPQRFVIGAVAMTVALGVVFYPALAAMLMSTGLPFAYQAFLPTSDVSFVFAPATGPLLPVLLWIVLPVSGVAIAARYGLAALQGKSDRLALAEPKEQVVAAAQSQAEREAPGL